MNGAFTIIGGVSSVVLSVLYGFTVTLLTSTVVYLIAAIVYPKLSAAREVHTRAWVAGGQTVA
jgi:phage shock protein PspC (stress-responsive transcriptional regulator)